MASPLEKQKRYELIINLPLLRFVTACREYIGLDWALVQAPGSMAAGKATKRKLCGRE